MPQFLAGRSELIAVHLTEMQGRQVWKEAVVEGVNMWTH